MVDQNFSGIGCSSIAELELPTKSSGFFRPQDGKNKIRILQGPVLSYVSQEWSEDRKPIGDKIKYKYDDPRVKEDKNAKLVLTYLIYSYDEKSVMIWDIQTQSIISAIKAINDMAPDLSAFDVQLTKEKGSNGFMQYSLVQGPQKAFDIKEAIDEVTSKGLLERVNSSDIPDEFAPDDAKLNKAQKEAEEVFA